jgi:glyoxylase-like metal-dependent hydrolase (beta-lactamase superfamily II)
MAPTLASMDWCEVDDRVFVRRHQSLDLNVGLIVGDEACLVVDTRENIAAGRELAAAVREVCAAPWTVVNTHAHFDHFLGNAAFAPADVWSLERGRDVMAHFGDVQRRVLAQVARQSGRPEAAAALDETLMSLPTHTFTAPTVALDIGGRAVTLHHLGRGHTDNDIVVTVADCAAMFTGDLVEEGAPPAFDDAYPLDWPGTLTALLGLVSGPVVPGHGGVVDAEFVRDQVALHERVVAAARTDAVTVPGLPDAVAGAALARARAQLDATLREPTPAEMLAAFGLS